MPYLWLRKSRTDLPHKPSDEGMESACIGLQMREQARFHTRRGRRRERQSGHFQWGVTASGIAPASRLRSRRIERFAGDARKCEAEQATHGCPCLTCGRYISSTRL